jgi:hypothetical protein
MLMQTFPTLVVCEHCDRVYRRRALVTREMARCGQCSAVLYRASQLDVDRWLALTVAAAKVVLALTAVLTFPTGTSRSHLFARCAGGSEFGGNRHPAISANDDHVIRPANRMTASGGAEAALSRSG